MPRLLGGPDYPEFIMSMPVSARFYRLFECCFFDFCDESVVMRSVMERGRSSAMYKVDDVVIYGKMGACAITAVTVPQDPQMGRNQLYYVLKSLQDGCVIYTPVDTAVFMRPAISAEEAERLIDMIPAVQAESYPEESAHELVTRYEAAIGSQDCAEWLRLAMSIYAKKQFLEGSGRVFGQIDKKFMKQAEDLLFGEMAVAIGIPRDAVQAYIASRLAEVEQHPV